MMWDFCCVWSFENFACNHYKSILRFSEFVIALRWAFLLKLLKVFENQDLFYDTPCSLLIGTSIYLANAPCIIFYMANKVWYLFTIIFWHSVCLWCRKFGHEYRYLYHLCTTLYRVSLSLSSGCTTLYRVFSSWSKPVNEPLYLS